MRKLVGTAVVLAAWASTDARPAAACGACTCDDEPRAVINLVRGVPLNLQIPLRVVDENEEAPWLERASDSARVAATVERLQSPADVWWLAVDADLEPNTDYRIVRGGGVDSAFTTGSEPDHEPPVLEAINARGGGNAALCGSSVGGVLTPSGATDGDTFNVWLELEFLAGGPPHLAYVPYSHSTQTLPLGSSEGGCFGPLELPPAASTGYVVGARLRDAAGNSSQLVTTTFTAEASEPGGCGSMGGTAGTSGLDSNGNAGTGGDVPPDGDSDGDGDAGQRTSKGCGCAVPAQRGVSGTMAALTLLGLMALRRQRRCCLRA